MLKTIVEESGAGTDGHSGLERAGCCGSELCKKLQVPGGDWPLGLMVCVWRSHRPRTALLWSQAWCPRHRAMFHFYIDKQQGMS